MRRPASPMLRSACSGPAAGPARWRAAAALLVWACVTGACSTRDAPPSAGPARPTLYAHRGIAQQFDPAGVNNDTCTAARMLPPTHGFLENTIASMRAAFEAGADIVEFDVHPTTDGQFAVFHDWTLDCRTEGRGVTREHSMAELKTLDIGHGYTADGGRTFPFRGKGVGMMPTLDEVLATFPDRPLSINVKSNDPGEGRLLAAVLERLPPARQRQLMVYGGDQPIAELRRLLPLVQTTSKAQLKSCLLRYVAYGWTGTLPQACHRLAVLLPIDIAPWLWGWPHRLVERMAAAGSSVYLRGDYRAADRAAGGIDTLDDLARVPPGYRGGLWTDEIELIAKAVKRQTVTAD
jgi:glycerophosphoryl diester phosphodiesterase